MDLKFPIGTGLGLMWAGKEVLGRLNDGPYDRNGLGDPFLAKMSKNGPLGLTYLNGPYFGRKF